MRTLRGPERQKKVNIPRAKVKPPISFVPTEDAEQAALFRMAALHLSVYPELALLFNIPNGAYKSKSAQRVFKATGLRSGVPDLMLPVACGQYHGAFIEMKRTKGGVVSETQKTWIAALRGEGYCVAVCAGWAAAWSVITDYLEGKF